VKGQQRLAFTGHDPAMTCLSFSGWCSWSLGYPDRALRKADEALALARELNHPQTLALALFMNSFVHYLRREFEESRQRSEASMAVSLEHELPQTLAWSSAHHGLSLAYLNQGDAGIRQARESIDRQRAMGAELARPNFLSMLAEVQGKYGRVDEALATVREALAIAERTGECAKASMIHNIKGELLLMKVELQNSPFSTTPMDESDEEIEALVKEAEESFLSAIRVAREQKAKSWELRATLSLCRMWQQRGRDEQAREMLSQIYNWFTEGFDTVDLKQARALLEELS
jgi:predicted ATPase